MSASQSNLSAPAFGYDVVAAVTQNTINENIKALYENTSFPEITICYKYDDSGVLTATDFDGLVGSTGVDPFSIPSAVYHKSDPVAKLDAAGFAFAIRSQPGIATGTADTPGIVQFNKGTQQVTYQVLFKEFVILSLQESGGGRNLGWTNVAQDDSAPWIFTVTAPLIIAQDTDADAFSSLPAAVQQNAQLLNPDAVYQVWKVGLDTSKLSLDDIPAPPGLDPTTDAATYLSKNFINDFFSRVPAASLELGYFIKPVPFNPNKNVQSIVPSDLVALISPEVAAASAATGSLNTLNFIIMTGQNKMPAPVPFSWNWVDDVTASGVVSINRNTFAASLSNSLSLWLQSICLIPAAKVTVDKSAKIFYYGPVSQDSAIQQYTMQPSGSDIFSFSYSKKSSDSATASVGTLDIEYTAASKVSIGNRQLIITTDASFYMDIAALGGHSKGYPIKYHATVTYDLNVKINGDISVTGGQAVVNDLSDGMSSSVWAGIAKIVTGNSYQDVIKQLQAGLTENTFNISGLDVVIKNLLCYSNAWVYPASAQPAFKDVAFSNFQDVLLYF